MMKPERILFWMCAAAIILVALVGFARAADVTLAWDKSPSPSVTGYVMGYGPEGREDGVTHPSEWEYAYRVPIGDVDTYTVKGLKPGEWWFAVTAFDSDMTSPYSNQVSTVIAAYTPPEPITHPPIEMPAGPGRIVIKTTIEVVEP